MPGGVDICEPFRWSVCHQYQITTAGDDPRASDGSCELRVENDALRQVFVGLMTAFHGILAGELARAREGGTIRQDLDPADGAVLLISLIQGLAMRWSLGARGFALQPQGARLLAVQMALFVNSATEGNQS